MRSREIIKDENSAYDIADENNSVDTERLKYMNDEKARECRIPSII